MACVKDIVREGMSEAKTYESKSGIIGYSMLASSAIKDSGGNLKGALVAGYDLSKQSFVDHMQNIYNIEISIIEGDTRVSSTIKDSNGKSWAGSKITNNEVIQHVEVKGEIYETDSVLLGQNYLNIYFPLKTVKATLEDICSGEADLTKRITVTVHDEIGDVVHGFNAFSEKLQMIISHMKDSKEMLDTAGAVDEISANISALNNMIENQSSGVTEASAAVEEMIGNIRSVNTSMEKMSKSFGDLQEHSHHGFEKLAVVSERVQEIDQQSKMLQEANMAIASIASETNLLTMNAAIEAAHAGEAGKGFAVVADEIRKLSETSTAQSKTIGQQLNQIKEAIVNVVSASTESSQVFAQVQEELHATDQLVMQIRSAMEEQNEGSRQITEALKLMNDSTIEVRNASAEMNEGNKMILEEVQHLQDVTIVMKQSMDEMHIGAQQINETGTMLTDVSNRVKNSIDKMGSQIDQFTV